MNLSKSSSARVALLFLLLAGAPTGRASDPVPEVTHDGLQLLKNTQLARVWMKPGTNLAGYDKLKILDCYVAFKKNWQRGRDLQLQVTSEQMERIKRELAAGFRKVFVAELEKNGGYQVVDETGEDVLLLRPAIIDLDIEAPDPVGQIDVETYAFNAGQMTLVAELYDSVTSAILVRAVDAEAGQGTGFIEWQDGVSNTSQARKILRLWADRLRKALDQAHGR